MSEVAAPASAPLTQAGSSPVIQQTASDPAPESTQAPEGSPSPGQKPAQPATKPAAPAKPELFEVKVDGKTLKLTRDELIQHASMGHAAQKRFEEAAKIRKQAEAVIGKLRDPKNVMTALQDPALGLSRDQIREQFEEWYAREFIEPESLTPEQKKLRDAEAKLKKYEDDDKSREAEKQRAEQEAMTAKAREELQTQIIEALDTGALPKTNFTIRRLAYWIQRNNANGFNAPVSLLVSQVKNEFSSSMRDMVEASDGEALIQLLGPNLVQKVRKYDLEQLRKLRGGGQQPAQETQEPARPGEAPRTSADVTQRLRELQRTGRY